jgi:transposase
MSKARLAIPAVEVEGRTVAEVVADYGLSRSWVYELLARYRAEGEAAFEPRSRRPHTSPTAISQRTVQLIIELRNSPKQASTPAPTPSPGTWPTVTTSPSRPPRSPEP